MKAVKSILYSRDETTQRRISGLLGRLGEVIAVSDSRKFTAALEQLAPAIVWFDILSPDWRERLNEIREINPLCVVILLGDDRSDPLIQAEEDWILHIESHHCPRKRLQHVFKMAQKHLHVIQERETYRSRAEKAELIIRANRQSEDGRPVSREGGGALREGLGLFSRIDDMDELLSRSLRFIKDYHTVGSVGVFLSEGSPEPFVLRRAVKCPREVSELSFDGTHPLVRWLRLHPCVIDSRALEELEQDDAQLARELRSSLKQMYAEAVFPLYGTRDLLGWLYVGRSTFGNVINPQEVVALSGTADQLAFAMENSLLHSRVTRQREHFDRILNALCVGVILFDGNYRILWANDAASQITGLRFDELVERSCKVLGSELASMILESGGRDGELSTFTWSPANSDRDYLAEVHAAPSGAKNPCGFLFLQDFTSDAAAFGSGDFNGEPIASTISSELRGPLVAIQTFVQLLPERYDDAEFRNTFIDLVLGEVARLERLSKELEGIPVPVGRRLPETVDATELLHRAVERVSKAGVIDRTEVYITGESGLMVKTVHSESLVESLGEIVTMLGSGASVGEPARIWVETYLERGDAGHSHCVYSFRGEGTVHEALSTGEIPDREGGGVLLGTETDWDMLKSKVATLDGEVNYGYNKKRSFVTLQLPIN